MQFPLSIAEQIIPPLRAWTLNKLNPEYLTLAAFVAVSTAFGSTLKVRASFWNGQRLHCNIFAALIGDSGIAKTPCIKLAFAPIKDIDYENYERYKPLYAAWKSVPEKQRVSEFRPIRQRLLTNDATLEALYKIIAENPRGVTFHADELAGWYGNLNRYTNGSDQQAYLSIWTSETVDIARKTADEYYIREPHLSIIGGLQPGKISSLFSNSRNVDGTVQRFLFAYPKNVITEDLPDPNDLYNSVEYRQWREILTTLNNLEFVANHAVDFTQQALNCYRDWVKINTKKSNAAREKNQTDTVTALSKARIYCLRLAGIIHSLQSGDASLSLPISDDVVAAACQFQDYYTATFVELSTETAAAAQNDRTTLTNSRQRLLDALPDTTKWQEAINVATSLKIDISEAAVYRLLNDPRYFRRVSTHSKLYKKQ